MRAQKLLTYLPDCSDLSVTSNSSRAAVFVALSRLEALAPVGHRAVGAIFVWGSRIVGRGHNLRLPYDPALQWHSEKVTLERNSGEARHLHAEIVAMLDLYTSGTPQEARRHLVLYTSIAPCAACAQALAILDIQRVAYRDPFENNLGELILREAGVAIAPLGE